MYFGIFCAFYCYSHFLYPSVLPIPAGHIKLGNRNTPEFSIFQWGCMINNDTLLAGVVCSGQLENLWLTFLSPPPYFEKSATQHTQAIQALAQSFYIGDFGSILGSLTTLILMHLHYEKDCH